MSAAEIIEQIKALPTEEQREVFEFVSKAQQAVGAPVIRFASDRQAEESGDAVVAQYPDVFRRLAE